MTPKQFIEKAIEGGRYSDAISVRISGSGKMATIHFVDHEWDGKTKWFEQYSIYEIILDPLAWQAVGKVEGWSTYFVKQGEILPNSWAYHMHRMIDTLIEGKTIEQFLETL